MTKRILIDAGIILVACGLFVGTWFIFGWGRVEVERIKIVKQEIIKFIYKNIEEPITPEGWKKLAKSKLRMSATTENMNMYVKCEDDYKELTEKFTLKCEVNNPRYSIFIMPGALLGYNYGSKKYDASVGGDLMLVRNYAKFFKIGCGVTYYNSIFPDPNNRYVGLKIAYGFDIK